MGNIEQYLDNPIKRHIITHLLKHARQRYSQLQPAEVDNVLFNYHLQHLVKNGLVLKEAEEYRLSPEGIKVTSSIAYNGMYFPKFVCRFKMYLIDEANNKVLFQKRNNAPWLGDTTPISSKLLMGTDIKTRADFRMKEKTNLTTDMTCIGTLRQLVKNSQGDLLDDCIYFICFSTTFYGELKNFSDNKDELMWLTFEEARRVEQANSGSGEAAITILNNLENKNYSPCFFEETITSEMF